MPPQRPPLTIAQILAWADSHQACTGSWPNTTTGPVADTTGETWGAIDTALRQGRRGLDRGSSLAQLLGQERGVRNRRAPPELTEEQILAWARAHQARTGTWPDRHSGSVDGT